jgi:NAD+ diphosphatase
MPVPVLNTFAGNPLDRAGDRRDDADWLAEQAASPDAMAMVLWEGRPLIEATPGKEGGEPRLAWLALDHARAVVPDRELFLGLWKGAPCFAVEVEGSADPAGEGSGGRGRGCLHRDA